MVYALFSVDWEANHGHWQHSAVEEDFGGVLVGTGGLWEILDELDIPCTCLAGQFYRGD